MSQYPPRAAKKFFWGTLRALGCFTAHHFSPSSYFMLPLPVSTTSTLQKRTPSQQGTNGLSPMCLLFTGFTAIFVQMTCRKYNQSLSANLCYFCSTDTFLTPVRTCISECVYVGSTETWIASILLYMGMYYL